MLLVDEAYVDFNDPALRHDLVPRLKAHPNLMLLRSLSKGYGLAGLRLGYAVGAETILRPMAQKTRDSYNVDVIAQTIGRAGGSAASPVARRSCAGRARASGADAVKNRL